MREKREAQVDISERGAERKREIRSSGTLLLY